MSKMSVFIMALLLQSQYYNEDWSKKSPFYVESPIEFPGAILKTGNYVIKLVESGNRRSEVAVFNEDESKILARFTAVDDCRVKPDEGNNTVFTYHDTPDGVPKPVRSWHYPGDVCGLELAYPPERAREIAKLSGEYVMAYRKKDKALVAVTPNGGEAVLYKPFK